MSQRSLQRRLRRDLPDLADHLAGPSADAGSPGAPRRVPQLLVAAVLVLVAGIAVWLATRDDGPVTEIGPAETSDIGWTPTGPGHWRVIADAPIAPRHFAATEWVDGEMIVWAGSSLDRGFAHTDGAAYNPITDTWRELPVPGWGHPGLSSTWWNGQLATAAKGGISLIDFTTGEDTDLEGPEGLNGVLDVAIVDGALHAVGVDHDDHLAVSQWDETTSTWIPAATATDPFFLDAVGIDLIGLGAEALIATAAGGHFLFTDNEIRDVLPAGHHGVEDRVQTNPVVTDAGFQLVVRLAGETYLATLTNGEWTTVPVDLPNIDLASTTAVGAGEWIMLFPNLGAPVSIHIESGAVFVHENEVPGSLTAPNTVWTGDELIVWSGDTPDGTVWTPPTEDAPGVVLPPAEAVLIRVIEPLSRSEGELETCAPQPCFGIPVVESADFMAGGPIGPNEQFWVIEGWYDGVSLTPTREAVPYDGDLGVLAERPDLPSLCPDIRGPGQSVQADMRSDFRVYLDTVPDALGGSWNDRSTGAQLYWFVGDDIAVHEAAIAEIAGDVEVCVAGGAEWSEAELLDAQTEIRAQFPSAHITRWTYPQRLIVDVPVLDPAGRAALSQIHPAVTISPPRVETLEVEASLLPDQVPVGPSDVDLLVYGREARVVERAGALNFWTVAFDPELSCFYSQDGEEPGERGLVRLPIGFSATADPPTIYDFDGDVWAREGDTMELGGGWGSIDRYPDVTTTCDATSVFG